MFILSHKNNFYHIQNFFQLNINSHKYLKYKILTKTLNTPDVLKKYNFVFKFFLKKKFTFINKFTKFYKFFYLWVEFFFKKFSHNLYIFTKLFQNPTLNKFAIKFNTIKPYQRLFNRSFKLYSYLINIFHTLVKFKSLSFFQNFIKRFFKQVNFFKHKFLIFYIRKCIRALSTSIFKFYGINGLYLRLHGKIAKAGNSRKQKFLIKYNSISTNHSNNYLIEKFQIFTFTGSIGCTILLSIK